MAEPMLLVPVNAAPGDHVPDPDTMMSVVGEEAHQNVLELLEAAGPAITQAECRIVVYSTRFGARHRLVGLGLVARMLLLSG